MEELGGMGRVPSSANAASSFAGRRNSNQVRRAGGLAPHLADTHYAYEDEDQSLEPLTQLRSGYSGTKYNSIGNIHEFFASRGKKFSLPKVPIEELKGRRGFRPGQKVKHPKYGEGTVYQRDGEGEEAKITVQFPRFGLKKLVEKYAQLEKA